MTLTVDPPDPPQLVPDERFDEYEYQGGDKTRRVALQEYLIEGAWLEAFSEWAVATELTNDEFALVRNLGLIDDFDFFWDETTDRVAYTAPGFPEDWREREGVDTLSPGLELSDVAAAGINDELDDLGEIVADVLDEWYVDQDIYEVFGEEYNARDDTEFVE